jgi:two-component system, sensor histidine kinase and response regulator
MTDVSTAASSGAPARRLLIIDDNKDIHADFRKVFDSVRVHTSGIDQLEADLFGGGAATTAANEAPLVVEADSAYQGEQGVKMAIEAARSGRPYDMAFVDVRMPPGIDGIQTIKAMWQEVPELPCVICTAYSDYDWNEISRELGKSSNLLILKKPFDAVEVLQLAQALAEKVDLARAAHDYTRALQVRIDEQRRTEDQLRQYNQELLKAKSDLETQAVELANKSEQLEHARSAAVAGSKAKGEFLANMSHELRTPLNGVIGMGQLLMDTELTPRQRRYVDAARLSAKVLLQLINDVLDFSKIEAGRLDLESIEFEPGAVIERVVSLITDQARQKGLEVLCFVDPRLPGSLRGDPNRWQQILINLLANSVKFTAHGSVSLDVAVERETPEALIVRGTVKDTGIGIPTERLPALFDSFTQVDSSTTRKYGGTGLGLSICKKLSELMGGEIGVKSEPGQGAEFSFTVRFLRTAGSEAKRPQPVGGWDGLKVLLVGESPTIVSSIWRQLSAWQIACDSARDGDSAAARLRDAAASGAPYQIAIVDGLLSVPQLRRLVPSSADAETAFLLITAPGDPRLESKPADDSGIAGYLTKPITASRLFDAMMAALQPAAHAESKPAAASPPQKRMVTVKDARILLVEDNEINQQVASELLRASGYSCQIRSNGKEAVEALSYQEYDLVLMDCQMPEMDGYEATRVIRQREAASGTHRVPIIALTANAMVGDRQRCLEAGMTDYLKKPLNRHELIAAVENHLTKETSDCAASSEEGFRVQGSGLRQDGSGGAAPSEREFRAQGSGFSKDAAAQSKESAQTKRSATVPAPEVLNPEPRTLNPSVNPEPRTLNPDLRSASSPPKPAASPPPLDCASLVDRFLGDWDFVQQILGKFDQQVDTDLEQLERSLLERNIQQTTLLAHRIKGAAANVSATEISRLAGDLERMGRESSLEGAEGRLQELKREKERLAQYIQQEVFIIANAQVG